MNLIVIAQGLRRRPVQGYVLAALITALTCWLQITLADFAVGFPFMLPALAVTLVAFFARPRAGVMTAIAAGLLTKYYITPPLHSWALTWPGGVLGYTFYTLLCAVLIALIHAVFTANEARERTERSLSELNAMLEERVRERTTALDAELKERVTAQAQVRQLQKMEAIGQLTGGVAHDFNNLLMVLSGSLQLLRKAGVSEERRQRYMGTMGAAIEKGIRLIGQLLAFARRQPLNPEPFEIAERLQSTLELVRPLLGPLISVQIVPCETLCWVYADPTQFDTALVNLLVNARDAMRGEGSIVLHASRTKAFRGASPDAPKSLIALSVRDSGSGIPAEALEQIFEPFFTTKPVGQGTGLGLSQVYGFAKQSGGEIEVVNVAGGGAQFTLYLPEANDPSVPMVIGADGAAHIGGRRVSILLVDDNEDIAAFGCEILRELGHDAVQCTSSVKALELLKARTFDLLFTDVVMPGMSGIQLAEISHELYPEMAVLLTTGYSEALARLPNTEMRVLAKPYTMQGLSESIRLTLDSQKTVTSSESK